MNDTSREVELMVAKRYAGMSPGERVRIAAEMKYWMELIGMPGGPVRPPCTELPEEKKKELRADLEATEILAKVRAGAAASPKRQAARLRDLPL